MRIELLWLFLSLPLLAGRELAAQSGYDELHKNANSFYTLSDLKMSENGRWLTIRKFYDLNRDTVLIFSSINTDQPVCYRTKVSNVVFLDNENILMHSPLQAELLNPVKQTSLFFKSVKQIQAFNNNSMFVLHYNNEEDNRLELCDSNGGLINAINNVSRFYPCGNDIVYAITEGNDGKSGIARLKGKSTEMIYSSSQKISYLGPEAGEQALMIYEQCQDSTLLEVLFLDLTTGTVFPLTELLSESIQQAFREVIREGEMYFLELYVKTQEADASPVDIWYGNDNRLDKKFDSPVRAVYYVWEPKKKRVWQIGNDNLTTGMNIGNGRYFLSYDPDYFNDYIIESTLLKIYVYDRQLNRYSVMDTIARNLYLSVNGEYTLYPEKRDWCLYHIPSGSRKHIPGKGQSKPWFTDDGKAILFDGDGALWRYDLKSGVLSEAAVFEGYQTSIVNGKSEVIRARKSEIYNSQVNSGEPLIIKLYDTQNNITSYILWRNAKERVIIPPTPNRVQLLQYNKTYEWFSWVEESFNLPPRMVFKPEGKAGKILYQSNKADKAILSLKQEIVEYTNSEGIPLKGILFYPVNYKPVEKYPMVVHIYEKQRSLSNKYLCPSFYDRCGLNIRLLLEKGYFVYLPDILMLGKNGPGIEALDCVNRSLDVLGANPLIDKQRIGLIGHSFGGYETDFIATHSTRFAGFVSGSGKGNITQGYFSFNYNFLVPEYKRIESGQYRMNVAFANNKMLYFENNPVYYAERVYAPVLLWSGLDDENVSSDQTMAFYNALSRNSKDVITLFYKGEGHVLQTRQSQYDLTCRILDWFDFSLKGEEPAEWISKGISKRRAR
jgi:dipeptidyl aminopeptidase/acylaminoacyl peptidase